MKCGVGDYTASLANALARRSDVEVAVLTRVEAKGTDVPPNVRMYPVVKDWSIADLPRVIRSLRNWRPDIAHFQFPTQGYRGRLPWLLPLLMAAGGIRIAQTWHEYFRAERTNWRDLILALVPSTICVVRGGYKERIPPRYRWLLGRRRLELIPSASSIPTVRLGGDERSSMKEKWGSQARALVVYFGFLYPHKGVDLLFQIAQPEEHNVVLIGEFDRNDPYHGEVQSLAVEGAWEGRARIAGFQQPGEVAKLLAAADAVVLPFRAGGGEWNSSLLAARSQGTFVLTTSRDRQGYSEAENVYYARPGDVEDMKAALKRYIGVRREALVGDSEERWDSIAGSYVGLYRGR
jgi:glycosyltransferase involved in cell wall biosynthesis